MASQITQEEQQRRKAAVTYARASVELEGFKISHADLQLARRFIEGEIELDEFLATTRKLIIP